LPIQAIAAWQVFAGRMPCRSVMSALGRSRKALEGATAIWFKAANFRMRSECGVARDRRVYKAKLHCHYDDHPEPNWIERERDDDGKDRQQSHHEAIHQLAANRPDRLCQFVPSSKDSRNQAPSHLLNRNRSKAENGYVCQSGAVVEATMSTDLISHASQYLTPEVLTKIGLALGLDRGVIGKACSAAVPALFGQFANLTTTSEGASRLFGAVTQQDTRVLDNPSSTIGGPAGSAGLSGLRSLLGSSSLSSLTGALGKFAGLTQSSSSSLLGMVSPMLMAILGKQSAEQGLNASGLANLLAEQKDHISAATPSGFSDALRSAGPDQTRRSFPPSPDTPQRSWGSWAWILPAIALALLGWWLFGTRRDDVAERTRPEAAQTQASTAVGGVDLKASTQKALDNVGTTLRDVKDEPSAQAAIPKLQNAGEELDNVIRLSAQLPEAGKKALGSAAATAEPTTTQLFDKVLAIPGVKDVAKPQIESLRAKLNTLTKDQAKL
jgi:hypothetical protein